MSKEPVKRKRAMFAGVRGGNSTEPKAVAQPAPTPPWEPRKPEDKKSQPRDFEHNGDNASKKDDKASMVDEVGCKASEFVKRLGGLGVTRTKFAMLSRTPYPTVKAWGQGHRRISGAAETVLFLMELSKENQEALEARPLVERP